MNRFAFVLALALLLAFGGIAMAQVEYEPTGRALPDNAQEAEHVFELNGEEWVPATDARAWNGGNSVAGHCNRECHEFNLETHVSVAQWIDFDVNATRKDWRVLKPGKYASDSVTARISSNNDVLVRFYAEDPSHLNPDIDSPDIATEYGYSVGANSGTNVNMVEDWVKGSDFSADEPLEFTLAYQPGEQVFRIWQTIEVTDEHRSSDYNGTGFVSVCVTNLKHWVDGEAGGFASDQS